jgi:hypothetical protein
VKLFLDTAHLSDIRPAHEGEMPRRHTDWEAYQRALAAQRA